MLARFSLLDTSRLSIDAGPSEIKVGRADGVLQRTVEVLKTLNLADETLNHGKHPLEYARWVRDLDELEISVKRQFLIPLPLAKVRHEAGIIFIAQGRIETILGEDLNKYSTKESLERNTL